MDPEEAYQEPKKVGVMKLMPALKRVRENIIPRRPTLDSFVRPYFPASGLVKYSAAPKAPFEFTMRFIDKNFIGWPKYDEHCEAVMKDKPAIHPKLQNSFVRIEIEVLDTNGVLTETKVFSGCLVTNSYAFTCDHAFVDIPIGYKIGRIHVRNHRGVISEGQLFDIKKMLEAADTHNMRVTVSLFHWGIEKGKDPRLEFAIIKLVKPFGYSLRELVTIPDSPKWAEGAPLVSLGHPTRPDLSFLNAPYNRLSKEVVLKRDEAWEKYIDSTFMHLHPGDAVACFGSAIGYSRIQYAYYVSSNISMMYGCIGGPVVSLERPDELVGLMIGGWAGTELTVFLDVQTPVVKGLYEMLRAQT